MHRGLSLGASIHHQQQQQNRGGSNNVYDGKIAGLYDLEETLGRGHFAVVKLARHVFTGEKVAVKVIDKSKLDEVSRSHLFQEVRCMKLVQHPNVVRLYEVIDTQTKLYLILELGDGGDLYDYIMRHETGLTEQVARDYFRQIVRAISYCHRLHVVHRDLKPENVVFFEKLGMVKLTDFGFSNKFDPGQKLETSCGSLAYSAPEILLGDSYDAPAVDVWSLGVILYMLVCGQAPFQEANDSETLTMIMDCKYTIPQHVSTPCKNLIRRMLIREPERRATLQQIANDPWLADGATEANIEYLPLVSRHQVSDEDHNLIIQKMVNGNIATKEEISEALDKNEYNHITATYFLLAERKLRAQRQEQIQRKQRPEQLSIMTTICGNTGINTNSGLGNKIVGPGRPSSGGTDKTNNVNRLNVGSNDLLQVGDNNLPNPTLLSVPRTPGDLPQRARKCSIVQEEEDEEDLSSCSGREDITSVHHHHVCSLNRRGSRSEGKLNIALQERIAAETAEQRRRCNNDVLKSVIPPTTSTTTTIIPPISGGGDSTPKLWKKTSVPIIPTTTIITKLSSPKIQNSTAPTSVTDVPVGKWRMGGPKMYSKSIDITTSSSSKTTILNESSTISIPIQHGRHLPTQSKYKTMPTPIPSSTQNQLNEIFEEGSNGGGGDSESQSKSPRFSSRTQTARTNNYEQRRSKFHKTRTTSCSSSDASEDDDSESRKKRAHKINASTTGKPLPGGRRDSHDDSSDSQDQGSSAPAGSRTTSSSKTANSSSRSNSTTTTSNTNQTTTTDKSSSKNQKSSNNFNNRRQHGRRRTGETRLRESQSLNRITEVQEDVTTTSGVTTTVVHLVNNDLLDSTTMIDDCDHGEVVIEVESNGTPNIITTTSENPKIIKSSFGARLLQGWSLGGSKNKDPKINLSPVKSSSKPRAGDENNFKLKIEKTNIKKMRLLGRYFQVHKKLCIPGIFGGGRGRIYKAQSCSSLARDRITTSVVSDGVPAKERRPKSDVVRNKVLLSSGGTIGGDEESINGSVGSDINQNGSVLFDTGNNLPKIVPIHSSSCSAAATAAGAPESNGRICQIHLGDTSKCCNLC